MKFGKGIVKKYSREYNRTLKSGETKKYTTEQIQITVHKNDDIYENKEEVLIIPNSEIEYFINMEEENDSLKVANYLYVEEVKELEKILAENNNASASEYEQIIKELKAKIDEKNAALDEIEKKYDSLHQDNIDSLKKENETIKDKHSKLILENENLKTKFVNIKTENENLKMHKNGDYLFTYDSINNSLRIYNLDTRRIIYEKEVPEFKNQVIANVNIDKYAYFTVKNKNNTSIYIWDYLQSNRINKKARIPSL